MNEKDLSRKNKTIFPKDVHLWEGKNKGHEQFLSVTSRFCAKPNKKLEF
jgi:hypothetical protein